MKDIIDQSDVRDWIILEKMVGMEYMGDGVLCVYFGVFGFLPCHHNLTHCCYGNTSSDI